MPLSIEEIETRVKYMIQLHHTGSEFSQLSDTEQTILGLIQSLNAHHLLLAKAIREVAVRVPGALSTRTDAELQQMLRKI